MLIGRVKTTPFFWFTLFYFRSSYILWITRFFHYILWVVDILHRFFHRGLPISPNLHKISRTALFRVVRLILIYSRGATAFDKMPRSFRLTGSARASSGVMTRHCSWVFRKSSVISGIQAQSSR